MTTQIDPVLFRRVRSLLLVIYLLCFFWILSVPYPSDLRFLGQAVEVKTKHLNLLTAPLGYIAKIVIENGSVRTKSNLIFLTYTTNQWIKFLVYFVFGFFQWFIVFPAIIRQAREGLSGRLFKIAVVVSTTIYLGILCWEWMKPSAFEIGAFGSGT